MYVHVHIYYTSIHPSIHTDYTHITHIYIYTPYQDHMVFPGMSPLQEMEIPATAPVATAQRKNEAKRKNAEPEEPGFEDGSSGRVENNRKTIGKS